MEKNITCMCMHVYACLCGTCMHNGGILKKMKLCQHTHTWVDVCVLCPCFSKSSRSNTSSCASSYANSAQQMQDLRSQVSACIRAHVYVYVVCGCRCSCLCVFICTYILVHIECTRMISVRACVRVCNMTVVYDRYWNMMTLMYWILLCDDQIWSQSPHNVFWSSGDCKPGLFYKNITVLWRCFCRKSPVASSQPGDQYIYVYICIYTCTYLCMYIYICKYVSV